MEAKQERWRMIDGFEGYYEVSDLGRVRSISHRDSIGRMRSGKVLQSILNGRGYLQVLLCKEKVKRICLIHRLVTNAFRTADLFRNQVDHIDGNKLNNCLSNLRYVTPLENIRSGIQLGLHRSRKLDYGKVIEIHRLSKEGMRRTAIANLFGVTRQHIGRVLLGKHHYEPRRKNQRDFSVSE